MHKMIHNYNHNPFAWASMDGNYDITSQVSSLELELSDETNQTKLTLENLTQDIDIFIQNKDPKLDQLVPANVSEDGGIEYHFNVLSEMAYVVVEVLVNNSSLYEPFPELYLNLTREVTGLNSSEEVYIPILDTSFPAGADPPVSAWNDTYNITGNPYLWIIPFSDIGEASHHHLVLSGWELVNQTDIAVFAFGAQCVYWNTDQEKWDTSGCKVGPLTSRSHTHCQCNHLSHFAAGFVVLPNTVHFIKDASLFAKILENPITAIAVGSVFALYVLVAVWANRRDRRAEEQACVIFLGDNNPDAKYKYHVTIFTGMRRGAGTSAVATITLYGSAGSSEPHVLAVDGKRKILQRGGVDSFVLATHGSLEELTAVRVWHDNTGKKPEWYLNRILVHDLQTHQLWYFLSHTWLAVDLGECTVDKTIPVATTEDLRQFHHLFITRLLRDMKDHHLWVSIFTRPPNSNFTRLQRVSCCFTLLMMSMLASIMFFGINPEDVEVGDSKAPGMSQEIGMGTIRVTWFDILVGIESGLIVLPGNLLILEIFRNARSRHHPNKSVEIVVETEDEKLGASKSKNDVLTESIATASSHASESGDVPHHAGDGSLNHQKPSQTRYPETISQEKIINDNDTEGQIQSGSQSLGIHDRSPTSERSRSADVSLSSIHVSTAKKDPPCCCLRPCFKGEDHDDMVSSEDDLSCRTSSSRVCSSSDPRPESSSSVATEQLNGPPFFMRHEDYLHHHINKMYEEIYHAPEGYFKTEEDRKMALRKLEETLKVHGWYQYLPEEEEGHATAEDDEKSSCCHGQGCLPWWFVYIGWFFVVATNLVCGYLVILYGLSYGLQTSVDWLVSMVVTLLQEVFVLQPSKVILVAAFFAIIWKKHEDDDVGVDNFTDAATGIFMTPPNAKGKGQRRTIARYYQPPPIETVNQARERREAEAKMCKMLKELLGQILLVVLALEVAHFQRDPNAYMFHQAMTDTFTGGFEDVSSINDMYVYLEESFVPELFGENRGYLGDESTYRVGRTRMRQVRISPNACTPAERVKHIVNCTGLLGSQEHTDRQTYNKSWSELLKDDTEFEVGIESFGPWKFTSSRASCGSYHMGTVGLYTRGGYIQVLGSTARSTLRILQELEDQKWLDELTRALYIEWTVFSADAELLCVCTVLFEATTMGNVVSTGEFHAFRLFSTATFVDKVNLALQSIYLLVILALIRLEVRKLRRKKKEYFHFWNILNILTIILSILSAVFYCLWATALHKTMLEYTQDPSKFTSFFYVMLMDQNFMASTGFLVFINTIRCAKILRFNSSIQTVNHTFSNISHEFFAFTLTVSIFLFAFALLFCLTFGSDVMDFKDVAFSFQTIFLFLEGGYEEFMDVSEAHATLGPLYFIFMTFTLFFLLFNFYILLILYSFREARRVLPNVDHKDVLGALVDWIFSVCSIKRSPRKDSTQKSVSIFNIKR
nr:polycystic kidney disease protein 1-like 2 [Lytechinus pictus]